MVPMTAKQTAIDTGKSIRREVMPRLCVLMGICLAPSPALPQTSPLTPGQAVPLAPENLPAPGTFGRQAAPAPRNPLVPPPASSNLPAGAPQPASPPKTNAQTAPAGTSLRLQASAQLGGAALARGLVWRVYSDKPAIDGKVPLLSQSTEAQPLFRLPPGTYVVNVAYGRASLSRRIDIANTPLQESFILNAGALRLQGTAADRIIPDSRITYAVSTGPGPGGAVIVENARAGRILRLPAGEYYVNSRYGEANAFMTGDVKIEAGRLTEVTMKHRAAQITLKLVSAPGGEALANTAWTVLTPGGDTVQESIGAFPIMVLGAGDYTVIARNDGKIYNARFSVDTGKDREVEVLAK